MDDSSFIMGMNQFVCSLPFPVSCVFFSPLSVDPTYQTRDRNPEDQGDDDHGADNIVLEELEEAAHADLVKVIPYSDNVLTGLFANSFVAKALEARSSIREDINRSHGVA